jgi:hypothetical protein
MYTHTSRLPRGSPITSVILFKQTSKATAFNRYNLQKYGRSMIFLVKELFSVKQESRFKLQFSEFELDQPPNKPIQRSPIQTHINQV